jgi:hypothetical protein
MLIRTAAPCAVGSRPIQPTDMRDQGFARSATSIDCKT